MFKQAYVRPVFVLLMLVVTGMTTVSATVLEETAVKNFGLQCWPSEDYDLAIQFSPVQKMTEASQAEGQWSYEFKNADKRYPENQIPLPKKGAVRVDLVLQLSKSNSGIEENYLWNVIVAPTVKGWRYGGHWPTKNPVSAYRRLTDKRQSLIDMATLSVHEDQPVHTTISPQDVDKSGTLNDAWVDVFGRDIVKLVYAGSKGALSGQGGYSLTFYYVPTPELRFINKKGYKWPSFKHVDKEGKVFGFVLTPEGKCIGSSSIDVVRN